MADRTIDDLQELAIPVAFAIGGLYLVYWVTQSLNKLAEPFAPENFWPTFADWVNPFDEGGFIDRWTLNPQEAAGLLSSAVMRTKRASYAYFSWTTRKARNLWSYL